MDFEYAAANPGKQGLSRNKKRKREFSEMLNIPTPERGGSQMQKTLPLRLFTEFPEKRVRTSDYTAKAVNRTAT
jgi:hypothetical protein